MKKTLIILLASSFGVITNLLGSGLVWKYNDIKINKTNDTDIIIVLSHTSAYYSYRFVFSDNNSLRVAYGERKDDKFGYGFIPSRDFMCSLKIEDTVSIPQDVKDEIIALAHDVIIKSSYELLPSSDGWNLAIIVEDQVYEINYHFGYYDEREVVLVDLLSEYSPIVIKLGWTGGVAEKKVP